MVAMVNEEDVSPPVPSDAPEIDAFAERILVAFETCNVATPVFEEVEDIDPAMAASHGIKLYEPSATAARDLAKKIAQTNKRIGGVVLARFIAKPGVKE